MIAPEIYFLLPYLLGLALSLGIAVYVRKYRSVESARFFFYKVAAESLIIAGFILETVSRTLEMKILWDNLQLVLDLALPGLGYLFVMSIVKPGSGPVQSFSWSSSPPSSRRLSWPQTACTTLSGLLHGSAPGRCFPSYGILLRLSRMCCMRGFSSSCS